MKRPIPFDFVLEELRALSPYTKPMFGCTAIYVGEKIVLILRQRPDYSDDNGVWLATSREHHESLGRIFPAMRSIGVLGGVGGVTGWQILPESNSDFENSVMKACELIQKGDPRIGKVPNRKPLKKKKSKKATVKKKIKKKTR